MRTIRATRSRGAGPFRGRLLLNRQCGFQLEANPGSRFHADWQRTSGSPAGPLGKSGWRRSPTPRRTRNVILSDDTIRGLIAEAHAMCPAFGLPIETAAVTGARVSQLARLTIGDVKAGTALRLMIPARAGQGG